MSIYEEQKYFHQTIKHKEVDGIKINIIYNMGDFYDMLDELFKDELKYQKY